jgi:hypothetical protein
MIVDTETQSGNLEQTFRRLRVAGLVAVVAAALFAAALASASAASAAATVVHSAEGGELKGGRLTLRGVSGRMTYATSAGRSGTLSVRLAHRRLFLPGKPATGTLHVAGHRSGDEAAFRLNRPRYNTARRTVSYRARPLTKKQLPSGAAGAAGIPVRRFGAASLSIVPHPTVASGDNGGNDCYALIDNNGGGRNAANLVLQSSSNWDTDSWAQGPPSEVDINRRGVVESDGGLARGCGFTTTWSMHPGGGAPTTQITISVTWPWGQLPTSTCDVSNPQAYQCWRNDSGGTIIWELGSR